MARRYPQGDTASESQKYGGLEVIGVVFAHPRVWRGSAALLGRGWIIAIPCLVIWIFEYQKWAALQDLRVKG